jgi:hypothetical protein
MDSELLERFAALEDRVRTLEDVNAIATLKAEYCDAMDGGWDRPAHDADRAIKLFLDDGSWAAPGLGEAVGRDAMYTLFQGFRKFPFAFHRITNQAIKVDGDEATGSWHVLVPIKFGAEGSHWIGGIYNDRFQRTSAGWRIRSVHFTQAVLSERATPWQVGGSGV